jgi:hypothetical protein
MNVSPAAAMFAAIGAIVVAVIGGYFGWRNSGRSAVSADQRAWLQTSMDEARKAKSDAIEAESSARRATAAANAASDRADDAERRLRVVAAQVDDLTAWIGRVVRTAHEIEPQHVNDPRVQRLISVINGGPASMSSSTLRRPEQDPR